MNKFVFIAVIAVLAMALYSIPSRAADNKDEAAKGMQNPGGQAQDQRKPSRDRTATQQKERERTKIQVPQSTPPAAAPAPAAPPAVAPEQPKAEQK